MNNTRQQYLISIRAHSAYPTYRGFIGVIALLGYLLAAAFGVGALVTGVGFMSKSFMTGLAVLTAGLLYALLVFLLARFFREAALILVDIGDSTAEVNSRAGVAQ